MVRRPVLRLTCLMVIVLALSAVPPGWSDSSWFEPAKMMPTSAVRAGMKGTARTVFSGVDIEEFNIEVLGVLPKFMEGSDVILIRVLDGPVVEQDMGIFSGMSGTPVYIGGRLIGAIAFSWAFERQPIAGVTPIESMLRAFEKQDSKTEEEPSATAQRPRSPVKLAGRNVTGVRVVSSEFDKAFVDDNTLAAELTALEELGPKLFVAGYSGDCPYRIDNLIGLCRITALTSAAAQHTNGSMNAPDHPWLVVQGNDQWDANFVDKCVCVKLLSGIIFKVATAIAATLSPGDLVSANAGVLAKVARTAANINNDAYYSTHKQPVGMVLESNTTGDDYIIVAS